MGTILEPGATSSISQASKNFFHVQLANSLVSFKSLEGRRVEAPGSVSCDVSTPQTMDRSVGNTGFGRTGRLRNFSFCCNDCCKLQIESFFATFHQICRHRFGQMRTAGSTLLWECNFTNSISCLMPIWSSLGVFSRSVPLDDGLEHTLSIGREVLGTKERWYIWTSSIIEENV